MCSRIAFSQTDFTEDLKKINVPTPGGGVMPIRIGVPQA
jgi:hypothetical protein